MFSYNDYTHKHTSYYTEYNKSIERSVANREQRQIFCGCCVYTMYTTAAARTNAVFLYVYNILYTVRVIYTVSPSRYAARRKSRYGLDLAANDFHRFLSPVARFPHFHRSRSDDDDDSVMQPDPMRFVFFPFISFEPFLSLSSFPSVKLMHFLVHYYHILITRQPYRLHCRE